MIGGVMPMPITTDPFVGTVQPPQFPSTAYPGKIRRRPTSSEWMTCRYPTVLGDALREQLQRPPRAARKFGNPYARAWN